MYLSMRVNVNVPMNIPYKPVPCALHSEYEIAIMHRKSLTIKWLDEEGISHADTVLPKDILVTNGEEFLVAEIRDNTELRIRLDYVTLLK